MQPLLLASRVIDFLKEKDGGAFVYVEVCYFIGEKIRRLLGSMEEMES